MNQREQARTTFPLLANAAGYRPCETDLLDDADAREYWLEAFRTHTDSLLDAARQSGYSDEARRAASEAWKHELELLAANPARFGRLDILLLDERRRAILNLHGIDDEFAAIKKRENESALRELPAWLRRIDAIHDAHAQLAEIVSGQLAGNLFDMGAQEMIDAFKTGRFTFGQAVARVPQRPWLIDDLDEACRFVGDLRDATVVMFVDNSGGDFVLGVLPLVRFLLPRAASVILAANESPSHNDVTVAEARELLACAADVDPCFRSARLQVLSNGHAAPLLDLRRVSPGLAEASRRADLVMLIGMGRSVESNLSARFRCHSWKLAMIKDPCVARTIGGDLFDAVCRFEPPVATDAAAG